MTLGQQSSGLINMEEATFKTASGDTVEGHRGSITVPENRSNPNSPDIAVHFVRLKSTNPNPSAPLVYLAGGPGGSCTWQAENPRSLERWKAFLEIGDVILLDQRGTGAGEERVLFVRREDPPGDAFASVEKAEAFRKKIAEAALTEFKARGIDLGGYTTLESARDMDVLRKALGYDKLSLMGFSYGTHLGQTYIKYFGSHVENAVLIGVEGLNHTYKLPSTMDAQFRKIAMMANSDPNVNTEVPDLLALYDRVIAKLDKEPVELAVTSPITRQSMTMTVGSYALKVLLRFDIGDASDIPVFPRLLYMIDQGDYSALQWFLQKRIRAFYGIQGMSATMDPASGATANRMQRIKLEEEKSLFKDAVNLNMGGDSWPVPDLGDEFREPFASDVRTLFMSGTLDFNTPPYQAEEVRWGFSNSSHIIVVNAGHEQILTHPDAPKTIIRFLKGEDVNDVGLSQPKLRFIPIKGKSDDIWHPSLDN